MKKYKKSALIVPISMVVQLGMINGILYVLTPETYLHTFHILFLNISFLIITLGLRYYTIERKEQFVTRLNVMVQLFFTYGLVYFAMFSITETKLGSLTYQLFVYSIVCLALAWYRVMFFWIRRTYRKVGGNSISVVVVGRDMNLKKIRSVFDDPGLGYRYKGYFDNTPSNSPTYLGKALDCFNYVLEHNISELYCVASRFNQEEMINLINFADNHLIRLKMILDHKEIFSRGMAIESYDNVPILNMRKVPLDTDFAKLAKRSFDIVFSSIIIITVLSWLMPLLYVLIKLDSPGPLFFVQQRHGLRRQVFRCYKFRTMRVNGHADSKMTSKNDKRITRIGKFLRRTSLDEFPQFFNVFVGTMSVVGPRPHMVLHTENYETSVDKYLVRHFVKPGITGLAQIKGYRGEILKKRDIQNRTRFDIFYVEKWSIWFDNLIIAETIRNAFRGEAKAY